MKTRAGFTLLEMLIVIAIMGIFMALGVPMLRPPSSYLFANDLKAMIQQARFEAIKRNTPVAVAWNDNDKAYTTRFDESNTTFAAFSTLCTAPVNSGGSVKIINTKRASDYRSVSVSTPTAPNGIVWLPTGLARSCTGSGLSNRTITINDGRKPHYVVISSAGRIRTSNVAPTP